MKFDKNSRAILPKTVLQQHGLVEADLSPSQTQSAAHSSDTIYDIQSLYEETLLATEDYALEAGQVYTDEDLLFWALDTVAHSPTGLALIRRAVKHGWFIGLSDLGSGGFHLDIPEKALLLDHYGYEARSMVSCMQARNDFLLTLIRGLRDIWQEERFGAIEREYRPEAVLMLERVRAADGDTVAVSISYELRTTGLPELWRHVLSSEDGDMAMALTHVAEQNSKALLDGSALATVFRQWFFNTARVNGTDHDTLEALDMVVEWAREERANRPFGQKVLNADIVEKFSCMPNGRGYLSSMGHQVCINPDFATLNDPINEAHLFQIIHDMQVTVVDNVPFRDEGLARKIFPDSKPKKVLH